MEKHSDARNATKAWLREIENAEWKTGMDIKRRYPSASFLSGNKVIFNIRGNYYRFLVVVVYRLGQVIIKFTGTHAEYDKLKLN